MGYIATYILRHLIFLNLRTNISSNPFRCRVLTKSLVEVDFEALYRSPSAARRRKCTNVSRTLLSKYVHDVLASTFDLKIDYQTYRSQFAAWTVYRRRDDSRADDGGVRAARRSVHCRCRSPCVMASRITAAAVAPVPARLVSRQEGSRSCHSCRSCR